jgi:D-arabinose 1-dehydrogenase-like Zn-dependent alcohol dehydrogenase
MTPYRGIKKIPDAGGLEPDRVIGVFGVGGLGAYAVQYAKLLGAGATVLSEFGNRLRSDPKRTGPLGAPHSSTLHPAAVHPASCARAVAHMLPPRNRFG